MKLLKAEYNRRSHLRPIFWDSTFELLLDDVYTRLKIVSRRKADSRVEDNEVNVFDIFTALDKGEDVMTLVEGSPGIGKTTFCLKLAYDWAHGKIPAECSFPKFEIVLLLKCRDIHEDVMETISEQLLPEDMEEKTKERLFDFIKDIHNQEKTLIILDGLDELPQESLRYVDKLLQRRILSFCYVLATSRQERGIDVRRKYCFDILLEIKGFTESDAFEYIRRHFKYVDPFHSLKGESLIKEIKENTLLHALRNNPLNLLLLCVVFEDYEGKLPSSRTELYHIIVLCLLRRYCAKHNLEAPKDNSALEKQFEETILALGELAWICLLSDRYCFREDELGEIESRYNGLVAREIGLLYKEESLKRLKPQHEYYFLHKTFQEYLAASYIVQRLRKQQFNVFEHLTFNEFVEKYPQVFIFVSGMLGEKATVLFTQIGEELKKSYDWNWNEHCSEEAATFFIESFSESGHAEQVAATLCNIIPFPKVITPELMYEDEYNYSFVQVLTACRSFLTLQAPAELHAYSFGGDEAAVAITYMESCSQLTTVSLVLESLESSDAERLRQCFSKNKNLSEFILKVKWKNKDGVPLPSIGIGLASCQTLTNVTFAFPGYAYSEGFFNALETGLAPLESVVFEIRGSTSDTAILALQKFLSNKSLKSLSLCIFGDVQDFLVAAFSEAFAGQTVLKSLDLRLNGPLSSSGAKFLEKGLLNNNSLNFLRVCVLGEPPGNWQSVVENLHLAKTSLVVCSIYPNTWNNVTYSHFHPVLIEKGLHLKQYLTVNFWGEISCKTADVFCNVLAASSITFLTLNMHGNVTNEVAISIAKCLEGCRTLSFLSINIWGVFTTEGSTVLSRLSKSNVSVKLNVHDVRICPDEGNDALDISIDNPAALRAFFAEVRNTRREKVSLTINSNGYVTKEWTRCLGDALAENTSLTSLDLTVNSYSVDADLGEKLGNSLLQSNSLTSLSLLFNCSNMEEGWLCNLGDCLDKMVSLTTLGFRIDNYGEWSQRDLFRLMRMKSLSTLSVAIHDISMDSFWNGIVGVCLRECTSLTKLSLTFNVDYLEYSSFGLDDGLAITSSLQALSLAIFVDDGSYDYSFPDLFRSLNEGLSLNASVTTLTVTLTLTEPVLFNYPWIFREGLSLNKSITRLNLAIHEYGEGKSDIPKLLRNCGVFESLAQSTSVTTFNLTLSSSKEVNDGWLPVLCEALDRNSSLTSLRLHCKSHCATGGGRLYDFSKLLVKSRSLSLLEREVSFYGKDNES